MAVTKAKAKAKPEAKEKSVATVDPALLAKAQQAAAVDSANRAADGMNVNFISVAQATAKALDEDDDKFYIEGLKAKDFYIQSKKVRLGKDLRVVPLAFLQVYNEFSGPGSDARFLGVWLPEDAERYPLTYGSYFNRELPNGNELRPVRWVVVYLPDFPDIDKAVITFKSTATKVAKEWAKDVEARAGASCQTLYTLNAVPVSNDKGKWFEIGYEFDGLVYEMDGSSLNIVEPFAADVIEKSIEYNQAYSSGALIRKRAPGQLRIASEEGSDSDGSEGDDTPSF